MNSEIAINSTEDISENPSLSGFAYGFSFSQHGRYSGYDNLLPCLKHTTPMMIPMKGILSRQWIPGRVVQFTFDLAEKYLRHRCRGADFVHYIYPENSYRRGVKDLGPRTIINVHFPAEQAEQWGRRDGTPRLKLALGDADGIICLASADVCGYQKLAPQALCTYLPHGIDCGFFSPGPQATDDAPTVLTAGANLRDLETWAAACKAIAREIPTIRIRAVASRGIEAAYRKALARHGLDATILCNITDTELREEYRRATVFLICFSSVCASNAILEAMACGLPVLASRFVATEDYLEPGYCGLFPAGDPEAAASAALALLKDPNRLTEVGISLRERALRLFSWDIVAQKHEAFYAGVCRQFSEVEPNITRPL